MNSFFSSIKNAWGSLANQLHLPTRAEIAYAISVLPLGRKLVVYFLFIAFLTSAVGVVWSVNNSFMTPVASPGGSYTEGVIGAPRFINPILAISNADRDLAALTYSGLMHPAEDNTLIPDLAESYSVSEDGLHYTFILKEGLTWHDGKPITADDVVFTIKQAQDPVIKSPKRASWEGVTVTKVNDREVQFTLRQPYAAFLENTTLGILPKHAWSDFSAESFSLSDLNTTPIGSGPYRVTDVKTDDRGIPISYELKSFRNFALGQAPISKIVIRFYTNERDLVTAYRRGDVEAMGSVSPAVAAELDANKIQIIRTPLPRIFGVFFNQNQSDVLAQKEVRQALSLASGRESVVADVLKGYGTPINSALLPTGASSTKAVDNLEAAAEVLADAGWKKNEAGILVKSSGGKSTELRFTMATSDTPELSAAAEIIKNTWAKLGAAVEIEPFEIGDLNQSVIRPRKYQALFFGEVLGRDPDPFPFWHSSQRLDPGLNIAMYANVKTDKLLEEARTSLDREKRQAAYENFEAELAKDYPAAFIYAPDFLYVLPKKIKGVDLPTITIPAERFLTINKWYIKTDKVWKVFANKNNTINN